MLMLKSTHRLLIEIKEMVIDNYKNEVNTLRQDRLRLLQTLSRQGNLLTSQQDTIKLMTQDLVILRGAGRISEEKTEPRNILFDPDVHVSDESELKATSEQQRKAVEEARSKLEAMLDGFNPVEIPEELVEQATPKSAEEWQEEHAP